MATKVFKLAATLILVAGLASILGANKTKDISSVRKCQTTYIKPREIVQPNGETLVVESPSRTTCTEGDAK